MVYFPLLFFSYGTAKIIEIRQLAGLYTATFLHSRSAVFVLFYRQVLPLYPHI